MMDRALEHSSCLIIIQPQKQGPHIAWPHMCIYHSTKRYECFSQLPETNTTPQRNSDQIAVSCLAYRTHSSPLLSLQLCPRKSFGLNKYKAYDNLLKWNSIQGFKRWESKRPRIFTRCDISSCLLTHHIKDYQWVLWHYLICCFRAKYKYSILCSHSMPSRTKCPLQYGPFVSQPYVWMLQYHYVTFIVTCVTPQISIPNICPPAPRVCILNMVSPSWVLNLHVGSHTKWS